uniref:Glycosyltransferase n=1 Tax=Rhizophora mucronata TaxID=61149 RepID=A0A2P2P037_RHIMU
MSHHEIWVIPFSGQGHLLPSVELCKHVASRNLKVTLLISSHLSSSVPSSLLLQYPLITIAELPSPSPTLPPPPSAELPGVFGSDQQELMMRNHLPPPPPHMHKHHSHMSQQLESLISTRFSRDNDDSKVNICAVVDVMMMNWAAETFHKFEIPTVAFFTSSACSAAMEYALSIADRNLADVLMPGELYLLPGLPEDMALSYLDLKGSEPPHGRGLPPPPGPGDQIENGLGPPKMGPPRPGGRPPWLEETKGSFGFMINTCADLERPFLDYIADQMNKPVWSVGPLLPEKYWKSAGSIVHDHDFRANRQSNVTEDEVTGWLDSKPRGSVLYVSFGSEVGPSMEEYPQLADALEACNRSFIWVIQPGSGRPGPPPHFLGGDHPGGSEDEQGYFPHGLERRVGERGLIIYGWAPQLLILSHPSVGGFLSHCGWNSTVEAIGRGVPLLAWPIRGDQHYNAQMMVKHLKLGCMISDDMSKKIRKDDIVKGIERLLGNEDLKKRASLTGAKFERGFPGSSAQSLDAFKDFILSTRQGSGLTQP